MSRVGTSTISPEGTPVNSQGREPLEIGKTIMSWAAPEGRQKLPPAWTLRTVEIESV